MYGVRSGILPGMSPGRVGVDVGEYFECGAASPPGEGGEDSVFGVARVVSGGGGGESPRSGVEA